MDEKRLRVMMTEGDLASARVLGKKAERMMDEHLASYVRETAWRQSEVCREVMEQWLELSEVQVTNTPEDRQSEFITLMRIRSDGGYRLGLLDYRKKIPAIKAIRDGFGMMLKSAKAFVDNTPVLLPGGIFHAGQREDIDPVLDAMRSVMGVDITLGVFFNGDLIEITVITYEGAS